MRRPGDRSARCRAALAVAALYALLLQTFLAGLHPALPVGGFPGVICAEHDGGAPADDTAPCRQHACCVPAQAGQIPVVPAPASATVPVPDAHAAVPTRRPGATLGARAPPHPAVGPRGPPTV